MLECVTTRRTSSVLVGREAELAALRDALKRARDDEPTAVLVGGEAGVGKTRLLEEFARLRQRRRAPACSPASASSWARRACRSRRSPPCCASCCAPTGRAVFDGHEPEFARLLPELGPAGAERRRPTAATCSTSSAGLFAGAGRAAPARAGHRGPALGRPLHPRPDRASWSAPPAPRRVLLVCTYRTDELHRGHPLRPFLAELDRARGVERIDLDRLDRDGTAEILTDLLGAEPSPRAVEHDPRARAGQPVLHRGARRRRRSRRLRRHPGNAARPAAGPGRPAARAAQRVLRIAAAGGTRFAHELLAEVAGIPEAELEPGAARRRRRAADRRRPRRRVRVPARPGPRGRARRPAARRARAGCTPATPPPSRPTPHLVAAGRAPAEIAHHWYAAHDHPTALAAARDAAEAAQPAATRTPSRPGCWNGCWSCGSRCRTPPSVLGIDHLALLEETLAAAYSAGDYHRALSLTRAALAEVDADAEPLRAARLLDRRGKLLGHARQERRPGGAAAGVRAGRSARPTTRRGPACWPTWPTTSAGSTGSRARSSPQEARRVADEVGDREAQMSAALTLGRVCSPRPAPPTTACRELRRVAERWPASATTCSAWSRRRSTSPTRCSRWATTPSRRRSPRPAPRLRCKIGVSRSTGAYLRSNHAEALVALGRWDEADAVCAEAARFDPPGELGLHWLEMRAGLRLARGHAGADELVNRALAFLARPYADPQVRLPLHALRIDAALAAGEPDGGVAAARAGLADPKLDDNPRYAWPVVVAASRVTTIERYVRSGGCARGAAGDPLPRRGGRRGRGRRPPRDGAGGAARVGGGGRRRGARTGSPTRWPTRWWAWPRRRPRPGTGRGRRRRWRKPARSPPTWTSGRCARRWRRWPAGSACAARWAPARTC